jgi:hypothetical protein
MFTFYVSLQNIDKYGIYLDSLDDIRYDMSLCPTSMNGHTITDQYYADMATTLYEKLSHTEVIPTSYQCYRHIIDKYVDDNDGYQVLYEMLEDEHPSIHQDTIDRPPTSNECQGDLQEYAACFRSYLVSERLNKHLYQPREQTVLFLKGLDTSLWTCSTIYWDTHGVLGQGWP